MSEIIVSSDVIRHTGRVTVSITVSEVSACFGELRCGVAAAEGSSRPSAAGGKHDRLLLLLLLLLLGGELVPKCTL